MAFLDNSGNIILDVVLTDHGRKLLAKGDGSFQITKFALSDEEIDYSLYNKTHASGSSYYDLEILQTPVLEALTAQSLRLIKAWILLRFLPREGLMLTSSRQATQSRLIIDLVNWWTHKGHKLPLTTSMTTTLLITLLTSEILS
jgi:hypothetical protein